MLWHIIAPADGGGHNSLDYRDNLADALSALRYWRYNKHEDIAIAKGVNGEPLRWVVYFRREGESDTPISVHATILGAKRRYLKFGRDHTDWVYGDPGKPIVEWGFRKVAEW